MTAVTPSPILRLLVAILCAGVIWSAVLLVWRLGRRLSRAATWQPQPVPIMERRIVLGVALAAHVLVALSAAAIVTPDSLTYYLPAARRVLYPWTLNPPTFLRIIGPGYPALIEILNRLVGDASALVLAQHLLMAFACYALWFMVRERAGPLAGGLTAGAAILCPYLLSYPTHVLTEGVYIPLFMIALYAATRRLGRPWLQAVALGALLGVVALVRVQALILLPFALVLASVLAWPRHRVRHAVLVLAVCAVMLAPVARFNAGRGYLLPASGMGRNLLAMASIHNVLDWSEPELLVSTGLPDDKWARAFFHPFRRPLAERRFTGYGLSLVGLSNAIMGPDFTQDDAFQEQLSDIAVARNEGAYWQGVGLSLEMLLEARSDFYYRECLWDTQQFVAAAGGTELGLDGKPQQRPTPSLTAVGHGRAAATRVRPWLPALGGDGRAARDPGGTRREPSRPRAALPRVVRVGVPAEPGSDAQPDQPLHRMCLPASAWRRRAGRIGHLPSCLAALASPHRLDIGAAGCRRSDVARHSERGQAPTAALTG